jgi:restriction system protein
MARKGNQSAAEDVMDLVAMLRWWGGVGLALLSYLLMGSLAARPVNAVQSVQAGDLIVGTFISGVATAGQCLARGAADPQMSSGRVHGKEEEPWASK